MIPISDKLATELNAQASREIGNSILYRHFSSWAHVRGLKNIAKFFKGESEGEIGHSEMLMGLLNDGNVQIALPEIKDKLSSFTGCGQIAQLYMDVESETTDNLDAIYRMSEAEGAIGISNQLQSMLQEQIEEEGLADRFSKKVELAGGNLILLDLSFE